MRIIKFSHRYKKMPIGVENLETFIEKIVVTQYSALSEDEIIKDTETVDGKFYQLPKGWLIRIKLWSDTIDGSFRWETIRSYSDEKFDYYKSLEGKQVKIEINPPITP